VRALVALLLATATVAAQEAATVTVQADTFPRSTDSFPTARHSFPTGRDSFGASVDYFPLRGRDEQLALTPSTAAQLAAFPLRLNSPVELADVPPNLPDGPTLQVVKYEIAPLRYRRGAAMVYVKAHGDVDGWLPLAQVPRGGYRLDENWWIYRGARLQVERGRRYPEDADGARRVLDRLPCHFNAGDVERYVKSGVELNRDIETYVARHGLALVDAIQRVGRESNERLRSLCIAYFGAFSSAAGILAGAPSPDELAATMKPSTLTERNRFRAPTVSGVEEAPAPRATAPTLTPGPGGKMLGEAVGILKRTPPNERIALFEQFAQQIEGATKGSWAAKRFELPGGCTVFSGEYGEALVFDSTGRMFRGNIANDRAGFPFGPNGLAEPNYAALKEIK